MIVFLVLLLLYFQYILKVYDANVVMFLNFQNFLKINFLKEPG